MTDLAKMTDDELIAYYKKEYVQSVVDNNAQMAMKILLNSMFGAVGNNNFRYYDLRLAASITLGGQTAIQYVAKKTNAWLQEVFSNKFEYLIYGDTDSNYFDLSPLFTKLNLDPVKEYEKSAEALQKFSDGPLAKKIDQIYQDYAKLRNAKTNKMVMEREAIAPVGGVFIAKKKYFLYISNMEGVQYTKDNPYVKAMGMELAKSGKFSQFIRDSLEGLLNILMFSNEDSAQKYIASCKQGFMAQSFEDIGILTAVNDVDKWIDENGNLISGTPIGPKALHFHNKYLDRLGDNEVPRLTAGDKIFYVPLRRGNPVGNDSIGFVEWKGGLKTLDQWVDKNLLWEKNFISPAQIMLTAVGWNPVKTNKLF